MNEPKEPKPLKPILPFAELDAILDKHEKPKPEHPLIRRLRKGIAAGLKASRNNRQ